MITPLPQQSNRRSDPPEAPRASRWLAWASERAHRFDRLLRRRPGGSFVLARSGRPLHLDARLRFDLHFARWQQAAAALRPVLRMAIAPIIGKHAFGDASGPIVETGLGSVNGATLARRDLQLGRLPEPSWPAAEIRPAEPARAYAGPPVAVAEALSARPLARAFDRAAGTDNRVATGQRENQANRFTTRQRKNQVPELGPNSLGSQALSAQPSLAMLSVLDLSVTQRRGFRPAGPEVIAERLTSDHRRVDGPFVRGNLTVHQSPDLSPEAIATAARTGMAQAQSDAAQRWSADPAPIAPPMVDVDRLTDQVVRQLDRRLESYRERMGRTF